MTIPLRDDSVGAVIMFGRDRLGLLHTAAQLVREHGGNVLKDRADTFETFAFVVTYFCASKRDIDAIKADAPRVAEETGTNVFVEHIQRNGQFKGYESRPDRFRVSSPDFPGLLSKLTGILAELGVTIERHEGEQHKDEFSGAQVEYQQHFAVRRPPTCSWRDLSIAISKVADERSVRWSPE